MSDKNVDGPAILAWDTELSPQFSPHYNNWQTNIYADTTLQGSRMLCFGALWLSGPNTGEYIYKEAFLQASFNKSTGKFETTASKRERNSMLKTIHKLLSEADGVVSWNGKSFDSKKINTEFILEGMPPVNPYKEIDLLTVARRKFSFPSNSLDNVSKKLLGKSKIKNEGMPMWLNSMGISTDPTVDIRVAREEARELIRVYQEQDVLLLKDLYDLLLPWIPSSMHPNVALYKNRDIACVKCGSFFVKKNGVVSTQAGIYQMYQCKDCFSNFREKSKLLDKETNSRGLSV